MSFFLKLLINNRKKLPSYDAPLLFTGHAMLGKATNESEFDKFDAGSSTISHELAHGMGIHHDLWNCCTDYVMCGYPIPSCNHSAILASNKLSTCSATALNQQELKCDFERLPQGKLGVCGNSIIEEGEECDCLRLDH